MNRVTARSVLVFALHQLFRLYVLVALSAYVTFTAMPLIPTWYKAAGIRTAHWILTETPYYRFR